MSTIAIEKYPENQAVPVFRHTQDLFARIREKAYSLFEQRGCADGEDLEDWLMAERELLAALDVDVTEKDGEFQLLFPVQGFEAKDVHVSAMPECIVVKAESGETDEKKEGEAQITEYAEHTLFRRIDLPSPIDVNRVHAILDKGVLRLTAAKAPPKSKMVATAA